MVRHIKTQVHVNLDLHKTKFSIYEEEMILGGAKIISQPKLYYLKNGKRQQKHVNTRFMGQSLLTHLKLEWNS